MTQSLALSLEDITQSQAQEIKTELIWDRMGTMTVAHEIEYWLRSYKVKTGEVYRYHMQMADSQGIIDLNMSLRLFSLQNHDLILDKIKQSGTQAEATRQSRAAAYISFTKYLKRKYEGRIQAAIPNNTEGTRTFFKIRSKVASQAMDRTQWTDFLHYLDEISHRYYLMAVLMIQGAKRISEVLSLQTDKINWTTNEITFRQLKTRGTFNETIITYPTRIMEQLKEHIGTRQGLVFVTSSGKGIARTQLSMAFAIAGKRASLPFHVHPHMLRTTGITAFFKEGLGASDIAKISGHASLDSVCAYDKMSIADNGTKRISLV